MRLGHLGHVQVALGSAGGKDDRDLGRGGPRGLSDLGTGRVLHIWYTRVGRYCSEVVPI